MDWFLYDIGLRRERVNSALTLFCVLRLEITLQIVTLFTVVLYYYPPNIYLFKVNNRNTRSSREIYSKLTLKTPEQCH